MPNTPFFLSLRWKLAVLFGCVFLIMHSIFSYVAYLHATEDFNTRRHNEHISHSHIARALTEDSFLVLEQLAEMLPQLGEQSGRYRHEQQSSFTRLDENWSQWQLSWGIENIVFFDRNAVALRSWGPPQFYDEATVKKVLQNEAPAHRIVCTTICFQQAIIPVIGQSKIIGAYSITRSFADIIIKYKQATGSDIGILFPDDTLRERPGHPWPYRLSGLTLSANNNKLYDHLSRHNSIAELLVQNKTIHLAGTIYEVSLAPIQDKKHQSPLFLFIDDITPNENRLREDLRKVWTYGVISLLGSLALLPILLHITLSRVVALSKALPLLAEHQYEQFRKRITAKSTLLTEYDELDQLNQTALTLVDQLESLEQNVRSNTLKLIEKSRELATERDFVRQLIDTAPIIILTQKLNGIILTINQAGMQELGKNEHSLKGKIFDLLIPETEWAHHKKLNQLREGEITGQVQFDGQIISDSGKTRNISWLHTLFNPPHNPNEAVILTIGVDTSERTRYEQKILSMAGDDPVTGLGNYHVFREKLMAALASARRYEYQIAVFLLDIDCYQKINDAHGLRAGEMMLAWVAQRLKNDFRSIDTLTRINANIFALVISPIKSDNLAAIAKKINQDIGASPFEYSGRNYRLSTHIGIALYPDHGLTANDLYVNADAARQQAKLSGPGSFHYCQLNGESRHKIESMLACRQLLEHAIAHDQFLVHYQPVRQSMTHTADHYECLLRLQQDDGLLMPETFITQAEELGLAGKIDRLMIKKALRTLRESARQGKNPRLSVNLSGNLFDDAGFYDDVAYLFELYGISPAQIIFAIPEATAEAHFVAAELLIQKLKTLGCGVALDDFGVSFSSFYYLKHLPIDYVKIGAAFIKHIDMNEEDQLFVKALCGSARTFGKQTIAKCVENDAELITLKDLDIDLVQGRLIGRPEAFL